MNSFTFDASNTFVINVESSKERLENVTRRLNILGIQFTRWNASTPDTVSDNFVEHWPNIFPGENAIATPLKKACAQSHINIWRYIMDNNLQYALIFEDDACITKDFMTKIQQYWSDTNDDSFDIIYLYASVKSSIYNTWTKVAKSPVWGTVSYIISYSGASRLLHMFHNNFTLADCMTSMLINNNHTYMYYPWLAIQDFSESTLGNHIADTWYMINTLKSDNVNIDDYNL
jgi:glycosyl transferase family 25